MFYEEVNTMKTLPLEKFDVALSFAGEDRQPAKELRDFLVEGGYKPFTMKMN